MNPDPSPTGIRPLPEAPGRPTLKDLLEEGLCLMAVLRGGAWPREAPPFRGRLERLLATFESEARSLGKHPDSVEDAKYAFCALADEVLLASDSPLREEWERGPLQLRIFGDHLAGEGFFRRLDALRQDPRARWETLEVFHACLLAGFQGRYLLESPEKVPWLTGRIGEELARVRGADPGLSPHGRPPFRHPAGRRQVPLWSFCALTGLAAMAIFLAFNLILASGLRDLAPRLS